LGFAAGPLLLSVTGIDGWPPFLAGLAALGLDASPLLAAHGILPPLSEGGRAGSLLTFAAAAPSLHLIVAIVALFDTAAMSLLPIYGLRQGLPEATAAVAVGVLIIGNVALQPPIGWLADRRSWHGVLGGCASLVVLGGLALPAVIGSSWRWPLVFAWGAAGFGAYTVALVELGRRFAGAALVAGAAGFSAACDVGGLAGPLLAGMAMDLAGPHGLPRLLGLVFLPLAAVAAWPRPVAARP
jgi:MFS family permease